MPRKSQETTQMRKERLRLSKTTAQKVRGCGKKYDRKKIPRISPNDPNQNTTL